MTLLRPRPALATAAALSCLLFSRCGPDAAADPAMKLSDPPHWIAHRGDSAHYPENTLSAVRAAFALDPAPSCVEIDVQLTRDGQLVVVHDDELARTTGSARKVSESDWDELKDLRAGFAEKFEQRFAEEPLPRLAEVLDLAAEADGGIMIEVKPRAAGAAVGRLLQERGEVDRHLVASFEPAALAAAEEEAPGVRKLLLISQPVEADLALAEDLGATILGCHHDHATPEIVAAAHAAGLYVWTYTGNDAARAATLKQRGVDGIISDRVGELRAELAAGAQ